ncbi:MAG: hypothetical protein U0441_06385 [Polyangiaceae bacterium]
MRLPTSRLVTLVLLLVTAPLGLAACFGGGGGSDSAGCAKDSDCKGDRICVANVCQDATSPQGNNQGNNLNANPNGDPQNNTPPNNTPPVKRPPASRACVCGYGQTYWGPCGRTGCSANYRCGDDGSCICTCPHG